MHTASDLNFNRGYEWWLMKEAKKVSRLAVLYHIHVSPKRTFFSKIAIYEWYLPCPL